VAHEKIAPERTKPAISLKLGNIERKLLLTAYTGCSIKNIRLIFSSFLTQTFTNFNNFFTPAFSDELRKKLE